VKRVDEDEYRSYVMARMDRLQRAAYLLCRDWHTAEDLVAVTFGKLYRNWSRARQANSLDAYVQTILMRSWLDEARRPWRRERVTANVPDRPAPDRFEVVDRLSAGRWWSCASTSICRCRRPPRGWAARRAPS
jgi:DNA-directed RNA polymerase specialized sigma24 family protein